MPYVDMPAKTFRVPRINDILKKTCEFDRYQDRKLWYRIRWTCTPDTVPGGMTGPEWTVVESRIFEFPVPVDDAAATGEFLPEMKPINLMRWIRQHMDYLNEAKTSQTP